MLGNSQDWQAKSATNETGRMNILKHYQINPKKIALLKGGWSAERDVSLSSATGMYRAFIELGFKVKEIDVKGAIEEIIQQLRSFAPDVVCMNALHGRYVEDGLLQGVIEFLGYPYTGSDVLSSAIAMNKVITKDILVAHNIPVAKGVKVLCKDLFDNKINFPYPFVLKPINEGSSLGVHILNDIDDLPKVREKWSFGDYGLIEEYIYGRELSVALLNDQSLGMLELIPKKCFYDYEAKYTDGVTDHVVPQDIDSKDYDAILQYCEKAVNLLGIKGVSRIDLRYNPTRTKNNRIFLLEANTLPGMTELSIVPDIAKQVGLSYKDLCNWMVRNPICLKNIHK